MTRVEQDYLGEKEILTDVYWGIHTQRAIENFPLSHLKVSAVFIRALAMVKKAACLANKELEYLSEEKSNAMIKACDEIIEGKFADQFPLDALQGGAGTSTNMNMNEVIANRAIEILGGEKGNYTKVHPIEDANLHQSTNDVYSSALKMAINLELRELNQEVAALQGSFQEKEKEFAGIIKMGRTEYQEAVPMTLGKEFSAFADAIARDRWRTFKCEERIRTLNIGGTAIGTGMGAPRSYIFLVIEKLKEISGLGICRGENVVDQTANTDAFVEVSGILKAYASNLIKIANDLRLLALLKEIQLPQWQTGSSIMPGKINPVGCEAIIQCGLKVIANDALITETASRSTLQINEFMPLLAHAFMESLEILKNVSQLFKKYVDGITANEQQCQKIVDQAESIITAFIPKVGYKKAEEILKEFHATGRKDFRVYLEEQLGKKLVDQVLDPFNLSALGYRERKEEG